VQSHQQMEPFLTTQNTSNTHKSTTFGEIMNDFLLMEFYIQRQKQTTKKQA